MGVHYVNGQYVGDAVVDPLKPEAMVYVQGGGGALKLGAVEYIVFKDAWEPRTEPERTRRGSSTRASTSRPTGTASGSPRSTRCTRGCTGGTPAGSAHAVEPEGDLP